MDVNVIGGTMRLTAAIELAAFAVVIGDRLATPTPVFVGAGGEAGLATIGEKAIERVSEFFQHGYGRYGALSTSV